MLVWVWIQNPFFIAGTNTTGMPVYWVSGGTRGGTWQLPLALGLCAIIPGILFVLFPAVSLQILVYLFGVLCLILGVILLAGAYYLSRISSGLFFLPLIPGICAICIGLVSFVNPAMIGTFLEVVLSVVLIIGGLAMLFTSVVHRETLTRMIPGVLAGSIFTVLGVLILLYPDFSREVIVRIMGFFLVAAGLVATGWAVRLLLQKRSGRMTYQDVEPIGERD